MINVLILEDEKYTREFIKKLIDESPLVDQVYCTGSGDEAISISKKENISIALFDIELENEYLNGLEVAKIIKKINPYTKMIFLTGYSKYAIDSFSVHPYDYILKPINRNRLMETINYLASECIKHNNDNIIIKNKNETIIVPIEDIIFIEKQNNNIIINTKNNEYISNLTLGEIKERLPNNFLRMHNSYIVNKVKINKLVDIGNRSYQIHFKNSNKVAYMSRYKYYELKEYFTPSI
jgi:two-component system LytT family response regulator